MSRTKHHSDDQQCKDLWSRRPRSGYPASPYNKLISRRMERRRKRRDIVNELDDFEK